MSGAAEPPARHRVRPVDLEVSRPLATVDGLAGYLSLLGLVRVHGLPLGYVRLPVVDGRCSSAAQADAVLEQFGSQIVRHLLADLDSASPSSAPPDLDSLPRTPHVAYRGLLPSVTVAVCTRDRAEDLRRCLDSLLQLDGPELDLLVVDNAPRGDSTERLVRQCYPAVRYVREPRPGLDWARNRAILEARGEIVAYVDDDVVVDQGWARALASAFAQHVDVMAVTGLVVPLELETEAQLLFERYGGFGRGFERRWGRRDIVNSWPFHHTAHFGTGANMAYRRVLFEQIGGFDPALDVGTLTQGGGDLEMFYRVQQAGHLLLYEPSAIVRHRHRRSYRELIHQLTSNGIGFNAYLVRTALHEPSEAPAIGRLMLRSLRGYFLRRLLLSCVRPIGYPRALVLAELKGRLIGLFRYFLARRRATRLAARCPEPQLPPKPIPRPVRSIRRTGSLSSLPSQDADELIVDSVVLRRAVEALRRQLAPPSDDGSADLLPADIPVSVVVFAQDRPDDLRACLASLFAAASGRDLQAVVVDLRPASGLLRPIVAEFPCAAWIACPTANVARASNAGFQVARGEIVVCVEAGARATTAWLERLLAPFRRPDVMAVTGPIDPPGAKPDAGFGSDPGVTDPVLEADRAWFESFHRHAVPAWTLGPASNLALRAAAFESAEIGWLDERLGSMATPLLLYRVLKAGFRVVHALDARLSVSPRRREPAGWVASFTRGRLEAVYHLQTLLHERDGRAVVHLTLRLPARRWSEFRGWRRHTSSVSLSAIALETLGNLAGLSDLRSWRAPAHPTLPARPPQGPWRLARTPPPPERALSTRS